MLSFLTSHKGRYTFIGVVALWLIYAVASMFSPNRTNVYHLTAMQQIAVQVSVMLPVLFVWLAAVYGAIRFKLYAVIIKDSPDGKALDVISSGLFFMVASYMISSFLSLFARYSLGTSVMDPFNFLRNHLPLAFSLVALWLIYSGSSLLARQARTKYDLDGLLKILIPFILLSAIFAAFFYSHIVHDAVNGLPNFSLPGKLPFYTMALPYLVVWFLGVLAIINIAAYIKNVKGAIYRQALRYLAYGLVAVLGFSILVQLTVLSGSALTRLELGPLLLLVYVLLIFYGLGFVLISIGARKLSLIEGAV